MRNAEGGTRNRPCGCRALKPAPGIEPDEPVPPSAFRVPRSFLGVALLTVFSLACGGDHRTPLIVYSPHGRDLLSLFERRFEQLHPDVDVRWLDMGSQEVYDRLRSERANPQADIWFGGAATVFARGAADSLLEPFRPGWAAAVAAQDWDDLLAPRWTGKILIRDPLASGTMRAVWGMLIERAIQRTGDTAAA